VSADDKSRLPSTSFGTRQNQADRNLPNSLPSSDDKAEPTKESTSKSDKRFNRGSSGRQYQVVKLCVSVTFHRSHETKN